MSDPAQAKVQASRSSLSVVNPAQAARTLRDDAEVLEDAVEDIPRPFTSYTIIGNLTHTHDALAESLAELARWHERAEDGVHYQSADGGTQETVNRVAVKLDEAAALARQLRIVLIKAGDESGNVRWLDRPNSNNSVT